jgi:hypothetical protein
MADAITAETLQQAYRLDDTQFDALAFGRDAAVGIFPPSLGGGGVGVGVDEVLRGSGGEIQFTFMERREQAEREAEAGREGGPGVGSGAGGLGGRVEEALGRVWKVCSCCEKGDSSEAGGVGFPDPASVREGLEVLDRFAEGWGEERREMQHRVDRFVAAVGMMLDWRWLFWPAVGRLGMGPVSLGEGDELWGIDGLLAPAVLRRADSGAFRFVGEAFVLGLMPGEEGLARADVSELVDVVLK